jgi:hypothetical protein
MRCDAMRCDAMQGAKTVFVDNSPGAVKSVQDQLGSAISNHDSVSQFRM